MSAFRTLGGWLSAPYFDDEATYRRARVINLALILTGVSSLALTLMSAVMNPRDALYSSVFVALSIVLFGLKYALHKGHLEVTAWVSVTLIWAAIGVAITVDGITSPASPSYLLLLFLAAVTLGTRPAYGFAVASVVLLGLIGTAEHFGWLQPDATLIPLPSRVMTHAAQILIGSILVIMISRENRLWLERMAAIIDEAPDGMMLVQDGRVRRANRELERILGRTPAELEGAKLSSIMPSEAPEDDERLAQELADPTKAPFELVLGAGLHVEVRAARLGETNSVQLILRDLGPRRQLEEQVRVAQRMEPVARLAGGVAHDFNNLLTVVRATLATIETGRGQELDETAVEDAIAAVDRGAALTRQLLTFARQQPERVGPVDLNEVVRTVLSLLRRVMGEDIELDVRLPREPMVVEVDRTNLEQVLLNLAVNARDAMALGGVLTVEVVSSADERHVELRVGDDGDGMDEETRRRAFEPFYTTKEQGRGTGLGLAVVHGVVKKAGGEVQVESSPGNGTTVVIRLTRVASPISVSSGIREAVVVPTGKGHVLIVEDDHGVRRACQRLVKSLGYTVSTASSPEAALALGEDTPAPDVLFLDTIMPGMSGPALAVELEKRWPDAKVILTSGYAGDGLTPHLTEISQQWPFVPKPYTRAQLGEALQAALRARDSEVPGRASRPVG